MPNTFTLIVNTQSLVTWRSYMALKVGECLSTYRWYYIHKTAILTRRTVEETDIEQGMQVLTLLDIGKCL